jgi:DNA-binding transcriptional ArsR family regulator
MRKFAHPSIEDVALPDLLAALADPTRLAIVRKLYGAKDGLSCADASPGGDVPKSTMSAHFRVLRESGIIRTEKCGLQHINRLRRAETDQKFPGLLRLVLRLAERDQD